MDRTKIDATIITTLKKVKGLLKENAWNISLKSGLEIFLKKQ